MTAEEAAGEGARRSGGGGGERAAPRPAASKGAASASSQLRGGAVHAVTLTWLAQVEGAVDDEDDGKTTRSPRRFDAAAAEVPAAAGRRRRRRQAALPAVVTLLDSSRALLGVAPVGDPLAEGLALAVDVAGNAEALQPAPPLPLEATRTPRRAPRRRRRSAGARRRRGEERELRALAEGLRMAPTVCPPPPARGHAGTPRATAAARAAMALGAAPAHRVHAACRRHGTRLGVEVARQKAEARALREGLASVLQRRETLARRLERAKAHADARERLRRLRRWSGPPAAGDGRRARSA